MTLLPQVYLKQLKSVSHIWDAGYRGGQPPYVGARACVTITSRSALRALRSSAMVPKPPLDVLEVMRRWSTCDESGSKSQETDIV